MIAKLVVPALGSLALAHAQAAGPPPPPMTLTATKSGVLPVLPTPFSGVETNEGAIVYDGPMNPDFVGLQGPAVAQTSLPTTSFQATLPPTSFDSDAGSVISGSITGTGTAAGVQFDINFSGFPDASNGPFVYHIHGLPVPADGNCTSTLGHLDPTNRGEYYPCNVGNPASCQAGDLAGKHGNITTSGTFTASFVEPYLSTVPGSPYYFGDKSIVIHTSNTTRLTCANFIQVSGNGTSGGNGTSSPNATVSATGAPAPTISVYPGSAARVSGGMFGAVAAAALAFFL